MWSGLARARLMTSRDLEMPRCDWFSRRAAPILSTRMWPYQGVIAVADLPEKLSAYLMA